MAKYIADPMEGFRLEDLISKDGVTFEIGQDHIDNNDEDDEEFSYSPYVQYSNEEMLNMLNMNGFEDDDNDDDENGTVSLCGISFEKLKAKMTSITTNQKVMKFVKKKGVGEIVPSNAQIVVHYIGYFEDRDEPFDSTYSSGRPRTLRLGQDYIIPGLEIGISTMQKHEIAVFLIHPDLAYKALGCPPRIPPNEEVVFVVHLINYIDDGSAENYQNLKAEERQLFKNVVEPVTHMLTAAKYTFEKYNFKQAIHKYKKIIDILENVQLKNSSEEKEMNELLSKASTNLGICYNKLDLPRLACIYCKRVPIPSAKSYYNFGKALLSLGDYTDAMKQLQKAYALQPDNETIRKLIQLTNVKQREYLEIEKRLWKNCFKFGEEQANKQIKTNELRKIIKDLCESVSTSKDVTRQALPEGLTEEEYQIIQDEIAVSGLNIVTSSRYGKEIMYVQKSNIK
ncbi:inactive peptidyl-prolyl cis-trans isomerase FKBP6 [Nylanderia fulva]|uniref:inactive peptidyl-prolyl cis-trans isomerase FKBP6 n=1 Tax=Nylanderia fulva TaxID=613905 RepID=UPI0010FB2CF1|nr:inactive peptidyl-prolyl cis-trans isomerase FKBP6 [Nylanderia fulva]